MRTPPQAFVASRRVFSAKMANLGIPLLAGLVLLLVVAAGSFWLEVQPLEHDVSGETPDTAGGTRRPAREPQIAWRSPFEPLIPPPRASRAGLAADRGEA